MSVLSDKTSETASQPVVSPLQVIGVIFVFALVGPPIGGLILFVISGILSHDGVTPFSVYALLLFVFGSYLFGAFQALGVGAVAAFWRYHRQARRVALMPVVLASCAFGGAAIAIVGSFKQHQSIINAIPFLGLNVCAGVGCWLFVNTLLGFFEKRRTSVTAT